MDEERDISKTAWVDVFADADLETLIGELDPEDAEAFRAVSEALDARTGWSATLAWQGLPWRWSLVYATKAGGGDAGDPALAYQIPDPRGPRVCIPVPIAGKGAPVLDELTKPVRKVLEQAAIVAGYLWPEWPCRDFDAVALEPLLGSRDPNAGK